MHPYAIIGLSFRLPGGVEDEVSYWSILNERRNLSTEWPKDRSVVDSFLEDGLNTTRAHFMDGDMGAFDAPFFSLTPVEAIAMDPQQRMALETSYRAFENAGLPLEKLRGSRTAVYGSTMADDYNRMMSRDVDVAPPHNVTGQQHSILSNRISWFFDLRGPSVHIDTACSSSTVALDIACQAMSCGRADMALILGVNILLSPENSLSLGQGRFLSPDGRCFSFDARANGYARGEGIVALIIKPLSAALRDGDVVRAVIRATGSNQDGRTLTLTQPSAEAQASLIRQVYANAKLGFGKTAYYEAHGTGTSVGDPIEMSAISSVFGPCRSSEDPLLVGAVKSNIGHLEAAAGAVAIVKAILALEKGIVPPTALFETMNPEIDSKLVQVPTRSTPWPQQGLRRVSVGSFGYGGTNSHVILDDAAHYLQFQGLSGYHNCTTVPSSVTTVIGTSDTNGHQDGDILDQPDEPPTLLIFSAADAGALSRMMDLYSVYYNDHIVGDKKKLDRLAYTLAARRAIMPWRSFAIIGSDDPTSKDLLFSPPVRTPNEETSLAFIFTGQGAQYAEMGVTLEHYEAFRNSLLRSDEILAGIGCPWSIFTELRCEQRINEPERSQPLCTALQIALVDLLQDWGISCSVALGHSSGEIGAAYSIGALSRESAIRVAFFRGYVAGKHRASSSPPGAMLAVNLSETQVPGYLKSLGVVEVVHTACVNSPNNVTLSGPEKSIDQLKATLDEAGIFAQKVNTGIAYHSPTMRDVVGEYGSLINNLKADTSGKCHGVRAVLISSVTGKVIERKLLAKPDYWMDNLVSKVRFLDSLETLTGFSGSRSQMPPGSGRLTDLIEIGPHSALRRSVRDTVPSTMRYHSILQRGKSALETTLNLVGNLFCHGHRVSVQAANSQTNTRLPALVDCPAYPFDHSKTYWSESRLSRDLRLRPHTESYMLGRRSHDWNPLRPRWRNWLSTDRMPWLGDHVVTDTIICPGTGFMVMAFEALKEVSAADVRQVTGFSLKEAHFLAPVIVGSAGKSGTETVLHLSSLQNAQEKGSSRYKIRVFICRDNKDWTECFWADAQVHFEEMKPTQVDGGLENRLEQERIRQKFEGSERQSKIQRNIFYDFCEDIGINYGSSFRLLRDIAWDSSGTSTARIDLRSTEHYRQLDSPVHPTILDACVHLAITGISKGLEQQISAVVPQKISDAWVSAKAWHQETSMLRLATVLNSATDTSFTNSLYGLADDRSPLFAFECLETLAVSRPYDADDSGAKRPLLYRVAWKPRLSRLHSQQLQAWCDAAAKTQDESLEIASYPLIEKALRGAAQKAIKNLKHGNLGRAPWHLRTYVASLSKQDSEVDEMSDSDLRVSFAEFEAMNPACAVLPAIGRELPSILSGDADPLELMFGPAKRAENFYTYLAEKQFRDCRFDAFLEIAFHENPGLRILEVGAGTGAMSKLVLDSLQRLEDKTGQSHSASYTFTDISPSYFDAAQEKLKSHKDRIIFKTLDLERDPIKQGYEPETYDLVIAGYVLHATSSLEATLNAIHKVLKPDGHLAFCEVVDRASASANVVFGTLEGWWLATEEWRQNTPLLTEEAWGDLLLQNGFSGADLVLRDHESEVCHLSSMIASRKMGSSRDHGIVADPTAADNKLVLLVDPSSSVQEFVANEIMQYYPDSQMTDLAAVSEQDWTIAPDQILVSLLELEISPLATLSSPTFAALQKMIHNIQRMLWVSLSLGLVDGVGDLQSSISTGFLRTVQTEEPDKDIVQITIEASAVPSSTGKFVRDTIEECLGRQATCKEVEFIVRDGALHVGRLVKDYSLDAERRARATPRIREEPWESGPPLVLQVGTRGLLDSLRFGEDSKAYADLKPDEVEIEAQVWPVSFRDIFVALGRFGDEEMGIECAGKVTRTGEGCSSQFAVGDQVIMVKPGCIKSFPRAAAEMVMKIPENLSLEKAAAALNPGVTAYHALINVARLRAGERILIHSGAGATGQMAIALAKLIGAEIFTTVGQDVKKQFLIDHYGIPADHIFYSRNTSFAKGIMRATGGYGADVVLNSLAGEGLRASWECIAPFGRFLEIGKMDIGSNASLPMASFAKNVTFAAIDMLHIIQSSPQLFREQLQEIVRLLAGEEISGPMPLHTFHGSEVEKAFRFVQAGTNIGRALVVKRSNDVIPKYLVHKSTWKFNADATYIVPGGLGGIGRAILLWMADKGAKHLIAPSRSGASSQSAKDTVAQLAARGVRIVTTKCDTTSAESLRSLLHECADMPPIKGCINSAMSLQDAIFGTMSHKQWTTSIKSKVNVSWNLHDLLPKDMDFFILLSSVCGAYGNPGQSNYAGGCTFQDALARSRTLAGHRCSISLDLGLMRTIGILAENETYKRSRPAASILYPVEPEDFFAVLDYYCNPALPQFSADESQLLVGAVTQADYRKGDGEGLARVFSRPLFAGFHAAQPPKGGSTSAEGLAKDDAAQLFKEAIDPRERSVIVADALRAKVARALGVAVDEIDSRRSLGDYGTDSLMAVELRNWMRREFAVSVAIFEIMQAPTITAVGNLVVSKVV